MRPLHNPPRALISITTFVPKLLQKYKINWFEKYSGFWSLLLLTILDPKNEILRSVLGLQEEKGSIRDSLPSSGSYEVYDQYLKKNWLKSGKREIMTGMYSYGKGEYEVVGLGQPRRSTWSH